MQGPRGEKLLGGCWSVLTCPVVAGLNLPGDIFQDAQGGRAAALRGTASQRVGHDPRRYRFMIGHGVAELPKVLSG